MPDHADVRSLLGARLAHGVGKQLAANSDLMIPVGCTFHNGLDHVGWHAAFYKNGRNLTLDDKIDTSPAVVGDELFMKGKTYLYCIPDV